MSQAKDDFIAKTIQYWNPGKDAGVAAPGHRPRDRPARGLLPLRHGWPAPDQLHLNGGIYSLGHRNPEVIAAVREGMEHFDIGNHHFPALMRTELAEIARPERAEGPALRDVRVRRRRGDRHRAEERPPRDPAPPHHLPAALLPRPYRPRRPGRRRPLLEALPVRGARGGRHQGAVQRHRGDGARDRQGRCRLRHHRVDPRHLRLPDAAAGLPRRDQGGLREGRHPLHRRRGPDRPDAVGRDVVHRHLRRRPRHDRHRQGSLRRHLPDRRGDRQRDLRRMAQGGRLGPHVELRRRRARLHRRQQGDGDRVAARRRARSATTSPTIFARALPRSRRTIRTSSSASASAG